MTAKQEQMEKQYVELIKSDKKAANTLLQKTNLDLLAECEALAEDLTNRIFTLATETFRSNFFANRSKKD